jgi:sugar/nucleoside kinase (ribokinase family)
VIVSTDDGLLLVCDDGERWFDHLPVTSIDSTGAGDAFAGGLGVAFEGRPIEAAIEFARAAVALATTAVGALPSLPPALASRNCSAGYGKITDIRVVNRRARNLQDVQGSEVST